MKLRLRVLLVSLALGLSAHGANGQGTAFSYQGRLNDGANPANGIYDLRFTLYDSTNNPGSLIAGPLTNAATAVSNGLFTVALDFGNQFLGANRWLEIAVRTNGSDAFIVLNPRQALTPAPYAVTAENLASVVANNSVNTAGAATVGGGLYNNASGSLSVIGGGYLNVNGGFESTIGGGFGNSANGQRSTVSGGYGNLTTGDDAAIGGGQFNTAQQGATVGGGNYNFSGLDAVVGGGDFNTNNSLEGVIGGGYQNLILANSQFSVIAGGYGNTISDGNAAAIGGGAGNVARAFEATIAGGQANNIQVNADHAMIGGGGFNTIVGSDLLPVYSTIGGGKGNTIQTNASYDVVGGGAANVILAENAYGTIAGGLSNSITGSYGAVAGGDMNNATANSFAAGHRAKALHGGTFVWGDAQDSDFASSGTDQFLIRASGGVGINTNNPAGAALNVAGTVKASTFQGDGSGLFNVGAGALGNYVFAIGGQQTIAVANVTQDITFDTDAQINGWMHTAGEASYTNSQTGLYVIQYTGVASISVNSGITISIRAALNGSVISGSSAGVAMTVAGQASDISRSFVVSAVAGDILKLQLRASNTSALLTGLSTVGPAVTMTMVRIQ